MVRNLWIILVSSMLISATYKDVKRSAEEALGSGNVKLAIIQYENFLKEENPGKKEKFDVFIDLADIYYYKLEDHKKALEYLLKAKQLFPESYRRMDEVFYRMGLCYEKMGDFQKAAEMYEKVVMNFQKSKYSKEAWDRINIAFAHNYQDTIAYVGGEYITSLQLENLLERLNPMMKNYYSTKEGKKKLLEEMIKQKLLLKEAEARKLYLNSDVQTKLEECKQNVLARAMIDELRSSITVTDKEIEKFYRSHLEEYKEPATIKAFRIEVKSRALADSLYKLLKKGSNFDTIRLKFSVGRDKKNKAPSVITKKGPKDKVFEEIFKTRKGRISKPIKINDSTYVIFKVIDKKKEGYKPLKIVSAAIKGRIKQTKEKEAYNKLLEELKKKYEVKIFWEQNKDKEGEKKGSGTQRKKK